MLSFFPRDVLGEILNLIESVSEGFPSYAFIILLRYSSYICLEIENLTPVAISYEFMKRTFGEFHKFHMK